MPLQFKRDQLADAIIDSSKMQLSTGTFDFRSVEVLIGVVTETSSGSVAANKAYVDAVAQGLHWKDSVTAATTVNVGGAAGTIPIGDGYVWTLSEAATGAKTIDGVTSQKYMRVLIKSQNKSIWAYYNLTLSSLPAAGVCVNVTVNDGTSNQLYKVFTVDNAGGTDNAFSGGRTAQIDINVDNDSSKFRQSLRALWNTINKYNASLPGQAVELRADEAITTTYDITATRDGGFGSNPQTNTGQTSTEKYQGIYFINTVGAVGVTQVYYRADDMETSSQFAGAAVFVRQGSMFPDTGWVCTVDNRELDVGVDPVPIVQFTGAGQLQAGNGIMIEGNSISVKMDGASLFASNAGLRIAGGGVSTTSLGDKAVTAEKLGYTWRMATANIAGSTVYNALGGTGLITIMNSKFREPGAMIVTRNGQMLTPDDGLSAGGTGQMDGRYGTIRDSSAGAVTIIFGGYLDPGDDLRVRYIT